MTKITPTALGQRVTTVDASGTYDWEKQSYQYNACKWGTSQGTSIGTTSGGFNQDDTALDSYTD